MTLLSCEWLSRRSKEENKTPHLIFLKILPVILTFAFFLSFTADSFLTIYSLQMKKKNKPVKNCEGFFDP